MYNVEGKSLKLTSEVAGIVSIIRKQMIISEQTQGRARAHSTQKNEERKSEGERKPNKNKMIIKICDKFCSVSL